MHKMAEDVLEVKPDRFYWVKVLCFSLLYGAYLMDYHWDHCCLLITLLSRTNYDSSY
jgi:hypothetical protein